jgi:hypothetical protein
MVPATMWFGLVRAVPQSLVRFPRPAARSPQPEQAKRPEVAAAHCYGGMRRKIQLPGFAICLP